MTIDDLNAMRTGAEIAAMKPYIDAEVDTMQKAVINSVTQHVNAGTLTPEIAMAKWMEFIAYRKLSQKFVQKINTGVSVGKSQNIDMKA